MSGAFDVLSLTMVAQTIRMAIPYAFAAVGGVWSEKSGVVHIGLEGILLASGLASVAVHHATGNPWAGVLGGVAIGALIGAVHGLVCVKGRAHAIISGIAINLIAAGGTRAVLRALYDSSSNSPRVTGFVIGGLDGQGAVGLLLRTCLDPFTISCLLLAAGSALVLSRTRFGLRVRAVGENPVAAATVGIPVARTRIAAVTLGSAAAALGGVALAYDQHQFQAGMSGGRGFIALAAVIVSGWRPLVAAGVCLAFASLDALQVVVQDRKAIPVELVQALPYVATLMVVTWAVWRRGGKSAAPSGLGRHEDE